MRDRDGLDAEEDNNLVKRGKVGNEMTEDRGNAGDELGADHADSSDADDAEVRGAEEREEPVDRDFVLDVELVAHDGPVVPDVHDEEEDEGEGEGDPRAFEELDEGS